MGLRTRIGVLLSVTVLLESATVLAGVPESPIPGLEVAAHWVGPCPREMPILRDLNGDGVEDYLLASAQQDRFKEYMPPEVGGQFGLMGVLMSQKAATGNKNFRFAAAVDGAKGTLLWQFEAGALIDAYRLSQDGKRLYLSSQDNSVYALDAATGKKFWSYNFGGNIVGLALSEEALVGATTRNRVAGIDPQTGSVIWEKALSIPLMSEGWGYLLEGNGEIYVVSMDDKIHAIAVKSGLERWIHATQGNPSLKAVAGDVLVVADGRTLAGVNIRTGKEAWVCSLGGSPYLEPVLVTGGTLLTFNGHAGSAAQLVAVDPSSGAKRWSIPVQKMPHSRDRTIIVPEDMNFFKSAMVLRPELGQQPAVLVFADRKRVVAIQFDSGKTIWETSLKDVQFVSLAKDKVVVQDKKRVLHCLNGQTGQSLWTYEAAAYLRRADVLRTLLVGTFSGAGGLVMDLSSGKAVAQPTLANPGLCFGWGTDSLFVSGGGHNWVLKSSNSSPKPATVSP